MPLTIFNGSPRGKNSNTKLLMDHFIEGYGKISSDPVQIAYLFNNKSLQQHVNLFKESENVIIAFPLYTDAMPAIVKYFIEALEPLIGNKENPTMGFIIQSGFPEPNHSRNMEKYVFKLTQRLGCSHSGTVIKGGVEGIKIMPPWMTKKLYRSFVDLGADYAKTGKLNRNIIKKLAPRDKFSKPRLLTFKIMQKLGLSNFYWDQQLKKNNAFSERFRQPF